MFTFQKHIFNEEGLVILRLTGHIVGKREIVTKYMWKWMVEISNMGVQK